MESLPSNTGFDFQSQDPFAQIETKGKKVDKDAEKRINEVFGEDTNTFSKKKEGKMPEKFRLKSRRSKLAELTNASENRTREPEPEKSEPPKAKVAQKH